MCDEKNTCCESSPVNVRPCIWVSAILIILVVIASAAFVDWRAEQRVWQQYGNEATAKNVFAIQAIQYSALNEQIAKDPTFFEKYRAQIKQQAGGQQAAAQPTGEEAPKIQQATAEQIAGIKSDFYLEGDPKARFTVFEFSDLECPYCKRQQDQGVIEGLMARYPGEVNRVFKMSPLPFHPQARAAATAILCAGEIGGSEAYYKGIAAIFSAGDARTGQFDESVPAGLGKTLKLDSRKFDTCYKSDKFKSAIDASIAQGAALGVEGTPGNVILDNTNRNYILLKGAYPLELFSAAIEQLKAAK